MKASPLYAFIFLEVPLQFVQLQSLHIDTTKWRMCIINKEVEKCNTRNGKNIMKLTAAASLIPKLVGGWDNIAVADKMWCGCDELDSVTGGICVCKFERGSNIEMEMVNSGCRNLWEVAYYNYCMKAALLLWNCGHM